MLLRVPRQRALAFIGEDDDNIDYEKGRRRIMMIMMRRRIIIRVSHFYTFFELSYTLLPTHAHGL